MLTICGCAREPIPDYVVSEEVGALPERHRDQIVAFAEQYFGTPLNPLTPRLAAAAEDKAAAQADEEGEVDESAAGDDVLKQTDLLKERRRLAHHPVGSHLYRAPVGHRPDAVVHHRGGGRPRHDPPGDLGLSL